MKNTVVRFFNLIKNGEFNFITNGIAKRINSINEAYVLRRDLREPFKNPDALIDLKIRYFKDEDKDQFKTDLQNYGLVEKNIPDCFVATTTDDIPCYRQWLMGPRQNNQIQEFWGNAFPVLNDDEALLESAFTIPTYRGKRIMPAAMARIAEKGNELGIRYVITVVGTDNIPSLKGCQRSGFYPYTLRREKWFMFNNTVTFNDIPEDLMEMYNKIIESSVSK